MSVIFYGGARDVGGPASATASATSTPPVSDILGGGNTTYTGPDGNYYGVATDPTGTGTVYRFVAPGQAGTNFFQVQAGGTGAFIGRTFGLTTGPGDPQWFNFGPELNKNETYFGNFAVNNVNGNQIMISASDGTIYRSEDQGQTWHAISNASQIASYAPAVAFGAPDPGAPQGIGNLDNFLYAGTLNGKIFMTRTGGGAVAGSNNWTDISTGIAAGDSIQRIVASPCDCDTT